MSESTSSHVEVLLQHSDWARSLARRLVEDASEVDDLVQDSYAVALEHAPARGVPELSWFARVMRNLARQRRRARVRRELRELASARGESVGPEHVTLERFEQHRALAEEVATLAEPFKSALLMRYFDGLAPEAIAKRTGAPVRTVHSRLHRGLAELRERLKRRSGGDERAWMLALYPLGLGRGGWSASFLGGVLVSTQAKFALALVVAGALATTAALVLRSPARPPSTLVAAPSAGVETALAERADLASGQIAPDERVELASDVPTGIAAAPSVAPSVSATLSGRVVDANERPLAGIEVRIRPRRDAAELAPEPRARTGGDGRFVLSGADLEGLVTIADPEWVALFEPTAYDGNDRALVVAAHPIRVAGTVVDERGSSVEGAEIAFLADELRARFPVVLDSATSSGRETASDARGRFELTKVPSSPGARLRVRAGGFETELVEVPELPRQDLVVVLRKGTDVKRLAGSVEAADGRPVADVLVVLGEASTRTDAQGGFVLSLELESHARVLQAVKRGHLPARLECAALSATDPGAWPEPLVLRLGGPPLAIEGIVRGSGGELVPGARLSLLDRTYLGEVEASFGGAVVKQRRWIESELVDERALPFVSSGPDGRFRIEGLLPRAYSVQACDLRTLEYGRATIEAGGERGEIQLRCTSALPTIRGRVVDRSGAPVSDAVVSPLGRIELDAPTPEAPSGAIFIGGEARHTDALGQFEFASLCGNVSSLLVSDSAGRANVEMALNSLGSFDDVEIVLPRECHVQVDLEGTAVRADNLTLLDAAGRPVGILVLHGTAGFSTRNLRFSTPQTEAFTASDAAVTLVLYAGTDEVLRIPLALKAGELNVIRP